MKNLTQTFTHLAVTGEIKVFLWVCVCEAESHWSYTLLHWQLTKQRWCHLPAPDPPTGRAEAPPLTRYAQICHLFLWKRPHTQIYVSALWKIPALSLPLFLLPYPSLSPVSLLDPHTLDLELVKVQVFARLGAEAKHHPSLLLLLLLLLLLPGSPLYLLLQLVKLTEVGRWRYFKNTTQTSYEGRSLFTVQRPFRTEVLPKLPMLPELHSCNSVPPHFDRMFLHDGAEDEDKGSFTADALKEGDTSPDE